MREESLKVASFSRDLLAEGDEDDGVVEQQRKGASLTLTGNVQGDMGAKLFNDYNIDTNDEVDRYPGSNEGLSLFGATAGESRIAQEAVQSRNGVSNSKGVATVNKTVNTMIDLPTFENTAPPRKLSLQKWQEVNTPKHFAFEMTSSAFIAPYVPRAGSGYVAACVIARDAHDDIAEWVFHHLKLGIGPIYVYDHGSLPPMHNVLKPWIDSGKVVYERMELDSPGLGASGQTPQLYAYDQCLLKYGPLHDWIAFMDVDEYLVFTEGPPIQNLGALLQRYERFSGLAVHWFLFGPSGHRTRPLKGSLRSYSTSLPANHSQNMFIKSIVRPSCTVSTGDSPHSFLHNCSRPTVRTDLVPIKGHSVTAAFPNHRPLALLHYATRSEEEFDRKMKRGSGMKRQRGWEYFTFVDAWSVAYRFEGLRVWDDNTLAAPRMLNYDMIAAQDALYAQENHDGEFWKRSQANRTVEQGEAVKDASVSSDSLPMLSRSQT